jgi:hypothetical protein
MTASDSITVTGKAIAAGVSTTIGGTGIVSAIIGSINSKIMDCLPRDGVTE